MDGIDTVRSYIQGSLRDQSKVGENNVDVWENVAKISGFSGGSRIKFATPKGHSPLVILTRVTCPVACVTLVSFRYGGVASWLSVYSCSCSSTECSFHYIIVLLVAVPHMFLSLSVSFSDVSYFAFFLYPYHSLSDVFLSLCI